MPRDKIIKIKQGSKCFEHKIICSKKDKPKSLLTL